MRSGYKLRLFAAAAAALILCVLFALWYPGYMRKAGARIHVHA